MLDFSKVRLGGEVGMVVGFFFSREGIRFRGGCVESHLDGGDR